MPVPRGEADHDGRIGGFDAALDGEGEGGVNEITHQQIADAVAIWLSKPFSSMVVQELSTTSWGSRTIPLFRMDVVAVIPNAQRVVIVECKASRSDFKRGLPKLDVYREFCHHLYVAAPNKMIDKGELPQGVGLINIGPRGGARKATDLYPRLNALSPERYGLMLERVMQKLVVARWQAPWMGRRPGTEDKHFPGDGCVGEASAIRQHLRHQDDLYEMAFRDWIAVTEATC